MSTKDPSNLLRAYLVMGTDSLKRSEAIARLKTYVSQDFADFNIDELSADTIEDPAILINSLQTLPFASDIRLVIVHNINAASKELANSIVNYLKDPNPQCVACFECETINKTTSLYKALAKVGSQSVVDCSTAKAKDLPNYAMGLASQLGLTLDFNAAQELVSRLGENTQAYSNQLQTFAQMYGTGAHITKALVESSVAQVSELKPWDFTDPLCERDVAGALSVFNRMTKPDHISLLSYTTTRIRELICTKALMGRPRGNLAEELKLPPNQTWKTKFYYGWERNFTKEELVELLNAAAECDKALKSTADKDGALISFILKFAA